MKAILIDDEPLAIEYLERQLNKIGSIDVVKTFTRFDINNEVDLLNDIRIIFLDIEMPEMNGLEMAEKITEINPNVKIVFVTAYNNYAVQAFELNALDYILKPVRLDRLQNTINRITDQLKNMTNTKVDHIHKLQISVCNDLSFMVEDELTIVNWRTAKAKELFSYLLLNQGKMIHKTDLVELFWSDFEKEKAFSLLYTTVYHIRKALKEFQNLLKLKNKQDGYILITDDVSIDLVEWEKRLNDDSPVIKQTINEIEKVMALYTGPYLKNYDYLWAEAERFRLENKWIAIALEIGHFYFKNNQFQQAESWLIEICQVQPENEKAHFFLLKLYASLNYGILVNHQYEKLKSSVQDLGLVVSEEVQEWYEEWNKTNLR